MSADREDQVLAEQAAAYLASRLMSMARYELSKLRQSEDVSLIKKYGARAHMLIDLGHNLPGVLAPGFRHNASQTLEWMWQSASVDKRAVVRKVWDEIGYDYGPLERAFPDEDLPSAEWSYPGDKAVGQVADVATDAAGRSDESTHISD